MVFNILNALKGANNNQSSLSLKNENVSVEEDVLITMFLEHQIWILKRFLKDFYFIFCIK